MTELQTAPMTQREHDQSHIPTAICWLCAEGPTWWRELRENRGMSEPPYPRPRRRVIAYWPCVPGRQRHSWWPVSRYEKRCGFCQEIRPK